MQLNINIAAESKDEATHKGYALEKLSRLKLETLQFLTQFDPAKADSKLGQKFVQTVIRNTLK